MFGALTLLGDDDGDSGCGMQSANQDGSATAFPDESTVWFDRIQSLWSLVRAVMVIDPPASLDMIPSRVSLPRVTVSWTGDTRCGRIQMGVAIWTKANTARVRAIAGSDRPRTTPNVTPRTTANTA